jgi:1-acyl-sn-glycerol-3-phosphate acyltransferase
MSKDFNLPVVPVATNLGCFWKQTDKKKTPGQATIEFLPPIMPGLGKDDFMARMEGVIETRTNELIAQATGQPVKPSVLVEWNGRTNVAPPTGDTATANLLP